jgi:hypothetical protein
MSPLSRRSVLRASGSVLFVGLAGCSNALDSSAPSVNRLVLRSDTGETEPIRILTTYAPRDDSAVQSQGVYDAHASGELQIVEQDDGPGFYNIQAESQNHGSDAFLAYNSHKDEAPSYDLQFEFVVQADGSLYSNIARTGATISIPGDGE